MTVGTSEPVPNTMERDLAKPAPSLRITYPAVILVSAFLLFQLEPMAGKLLLPAYGGSASVWSVCLFFFQLLLLAGYAYAYLMTTFLAPRMQVGAHMTLLAAATLTLPVWSQGQSQAVGPHDPYLSILEALLLGIGAPFFLLSATNPLLQSWRSRISPNTNPYTLYAFSNAGSLLGLLTYPFVIEVWLSLGRQAKLWSVSFGVLAMICAFVGARSQREYASFLPTDEATPIPPWPIQAIWIAFPACASATLLAVTNHITQDLAAVPLLWIVPLGLYLFSFIICFAEHSLYRRRSFVRMLVIALVAMVTALAVPQVALHSLVTTGIFCAGLFMCCAVCHGEFYLVRPHRDHLARYYLFAALGGVLGSAFVALLAPHIFPGFYELPISMTCCGLIARFYAATPSKSETGISSPSLSRSSLILLVVLGMSLYLITKRQGNGLQLSARNFFGVLRVEDHTIPTADQLPGDNLDPRYRELLNGSTNHGIQFLSPQRRREATTYYGLRSGVAVGLHSFERERRLHVGIVGLGAGTLALYGRPGDVYTFYEINPLVVSVARTQFTFLSESAARTETVTGDGRLSLEREMGQRFDVLAIDAFSGDAVPTHLLTREAFQLYKARLQPDGLLAVHITNKYLNLAPVVLSAAASLHWDAVVVTSKGDPEAATLPATWVLLGASPKAISIARYAGDELSVPSEAQPNHLWTDDYSSLVRAMRW